MRYYKTIIGEYIISIGMGNGGIEITKDEYAEILSAIQNKPERTESTDYRLKTDLTWERYDVAPTPEPEPEPDAEELLSILTGGEL